MYLIIWWYHIYLLSTGETTGMQRSASLTALTVQTLTPAHSISHFVTLSPRKWMANVMRMEPVRLGNVGTTVRSTVWGCSPTWQGLSQVSVIFINIEKKVIYYQLELRKNNLPTFDWMLQSSSKEKEVKPCSHALLRRHVIGGQMLVRIAPPSLPPHHLPPIFHPNLSHHKLFSELVNR